MAIEIAVRAAYKGRNNWKQAIFINESELDGPLSDVRTIIAKQDIEVPQDYRFLSVSGNVIPWTIEETLVLREITLTGSKSNLDKNEKENDVKAETSGSHDVHINDKDTVGTKDKNTSVPELWIAAPGDMSYLRDDAHKDDIGGSNISEERANMAMYGHLCPWKAFSNFAHDGNGSRNFFKLLFFIVALLFLLLVSLVLTTHVVFGLFSTVTSHPEFNSLLSKLKMGGGSSEEVTNLRLKVSELELSWKFKFDQLNGKLMELEDLYLNDIAKHKREMASLRNQQLDFSGTFASQKEFETLQGKVDEVMTYLNEQQGIDAVVKEHETKKWKKSKGREGL